MPTRRIRSIAVGVSVSLLVALGLTACADDSDDNSIPLPSDGLETPITTFDGGTTTLGEYAGTPMVVNFFASWCTPCIVEMPEIEQVHQELGDRVAFVGLNYDDTAEKGAEVVERTGVTYDVGRDVDGALFRLFGGLGMPTTVFIRADGSVAEVRSIALDADDFRDLIREELDVS